MGRRTVLVLLVAALQVGVIFGQAPFLKKEPQCAALRGRKLYHVCNAGAELRAARSAPHVNPIAEAVMNNAQSLLDKASNLIGRTPSTTTSPNRQAPKNDAVDQLKDASQTLTVSSCVFRNAANVLDDAVAVLNNAIRIMEGVNVGTQQDESKQEAPVVSNVTVVKVVSNPGTVDVSPVGNAKPVLPSPTAEPSQQPNTSTPSTQALNPQNINILNFNLPHLNLPNSNPKPPNPPASIPPNSYPLNSIPPNSNPLNSNPQNSSSPEDVAKLSFLNTRVHTLSSDVAVLLQQLGLALTMPRRSQAFVKLTRAPLEEIQQIQLVIARSEGAELEDVPEAEEIVQGLQRHQQNLQRLVDKPEELTEKLKQPKDRTVSQALVTELRALKETVIKVLPFPQEIY